MYDTTIYLMTRNRPQFILRAINSILSQSFGEFNFIISDNSTNLKTKELIQNANIKDYRLSYLKREPSYNSLIDHLNVIHKEVQSHYYLIFHDDDVMLPNMIEKLYAEIQGRHDVVAVAAFAYEIKNGKKVISKMCKSKQIINSPLALIDEYASGGISPFPAYLFNRDLMKGLLLDKNKGGQYCDCSFIVSLTQRGNVIQIPFRLMEYTIHNGQVSQDHQYSQYLSLTTYLKSVVGKSDVERISKLRVFNIYNERVRRFRMYNEPLFNLKLLFLFFKYSPKRFFPRYIIRILYSYVK